MKVYLAADHGGYLLKEEIKKYLSELGYDVEDMGAHSLDHQDDYPDFVIPAAQKVASHFAEASRDKQGKPALGIVLGRSGNGEQIAANKVKGVRAALCFTPEEAKLARGKNHANVLSIAADFIDIETAKSVVKTFLETPFSDEERHKRRIEKITDYENRRG